MVLSFQRYCDLIRVLQVIMCQETRKGAEVGAEVSHLFLRMDSNHNVKDWLIASLSNGV